MSASQSDPLPLETRPPGVPAKWLGVLVAIVAMAAFSPILGHDFITLDDGILVSKNPDFNPPQVAHWGHYWTGPKVDDLKPHELYMPVTYMVWGGTAMIARSGDEADKSAEKTTLNATVFHGLSLLLHAINAVLVFVILGKLVPGGWPAFFGAVLFAVHPLQTESVAWVAETSILLSGVFSLWAILGFMRFMELPDSVGGRWIHYGLANFALAMALLSKAPAVVVPPIVLVIELGLRRRSLRKLFWPLAVWAAICLPIVILTSHWQRSHFTVPVWQRPIVAGDALAFYMYKLLLPIGLLPNYGRTPAWLMAHPAIAASTWLGPATLLVVCLLLWRRARWVAVAALVFAIALLPVLGLSVFVYQRFSTTADRYVYLAMLGPGLVLAGLLALGPRVTSFAAAGVLLATLAAMSAMQSMIWADSLSLFTRVIEANPQSQKGQEQVAVAYDAKAQKALAESAAYVAEGRRDMAASSRQMARDCILSAREHFLLAAALPEDDGVSYYNAGNCSFTLHETEKAIEFFKRALADEKFELRAAAYNRMGVCYQQLAHAEKDAQKSLAQALDPLMQSKPLSDSDKAAKKQELESSRERDLADLEAAQDAYRNALKASDSPDYAPEHAVAVESLKRMELDKKMGAAN